MISNFEHMYMHMIKNVLENGEEIKNERTGLMVKRLPNQILTTDLANELPILKSKQVFWKSAVQEILWIFQKQSNNVKDLGNHIWDKWVDEDGTIGNAYGAQAAKEVRIKQGDDICVYDNQMEYVLRTLAENPSDRRCVIDLWDPQELDEMHLTPCVYTSVWNLAGGRLNCSILQRSGDLLVGEVFNIFEYAVLNMMMASHLGVNPGIVSILIADAHIYENQIESFVNEQMPNYQDMLEAEQSGKSENTVLVDILNSEPRLIVPKDKSFWDITEDDIEVKNYLFCSRVAYPVAE